VSLVLTQEICSRVEEFRRARRTGVLVLLFTDIVGSTLLKQELGDSKAFALIQEHHFLLRQCLARFPDGREIETAGDSFFIVFVKPSDAVIFSLQWQQALRQWSVAGGYGIADRIGLHAGEVVLEEKEGARKALELFGIQVDTCSRVMSLAEGGQILATRFVFDNARPLLKGSELPGLEPLSWLNHGPYEVKGVEDSIELCEVGEIGKARLRRPRDGEKGRSVASPETVLVLGWRPAIASMVPDTAWMLERKLGEGGFGEVWVARHVTLKDRRVFKFCFQAARVRSLKREVTLFRLLRERFGNHPNIVGIQDVFFDEPPFYIIMDYADGEDLTRWAERRGGLDKVPLAVRLEIAAQVADALQAAHEAGVIHRDVKPSNVIVCEEGPEKVRVKLTDFGVAQVVAPEILAGVTRMGFTQATTGSSNTGTPMYMAPEILAGQPASTRSDIYSLGVVLYQLVTADLRRPATMDWGREVTDPLLREDLAKCLAGNPQERFAGTKELALRLRCLDERRKALARQAVESAARERAAQRQRFLRASLLAIFTGVALLTTWIGVPLTCWSYDALFWWRAPTPADEVRMIYLDEVSHRALKQPSESPYDRSLYAQLIDRLIAEGAKLIVFDIIFAEASTNLDADKKLAEAIRRSGRVVLAGEHSMATDKVNQWELLPYKPFLSASAGWGNAELVVDPDGRVRRFSTDVGIVEQTNVLWLPRLAAKLAGATSPPSASANGWFNFVGPQGVLDDTSFHDALSADGLEPGHFKNKTVFIGLHLKERYSGSMKHEMRDEYSTPYSDWAREPGVSGVDFLAIATLNLLRHCWLMRLPAWVEIMVTVAIAVASSFGLMRLRPLLATALAIGIMAVTYAATRLLASQEFLWFPWLVVCAELVVVLAFSIVLEFARLYAAKRTSRKNFQTRNATITDAPTT